MLVSRGLASNKVEASRLLAVLKAMSRNIMRSWWWLVALRFILDQTFLQPRCAAFAHILCYNCASVIIFAPTRRDLIQFRGSSLFDAT